MTMSDPYKTHGAFSWLELMTNDPVAAGEFYKEIFGWSVQAMPMPSGEGEYHIASIGDKQFGGMMAKPPGYEGPPMWGGYFTVEDVDAIVEKVTSLGGKVHKPAETIPGVGRFAVLADPQGAVFQVMAYSMAENGADC